MAATGIIINTGGKWIGRFYKLPKIKQRWPRFNPKKLVETQPMTANIPPSLKAACDKEILIPKWAQRVDRMMRNSLSLKIDELAIDGIFALSNNGRLVPASNPHGDDVWFVFADEWRNTVIIYNGETSMPCMMKSNKNDHDLFEVWLDVKKYVILLESDLKVMDQKIAKYVEQF